MILKKFIAVGLFLLPLFVYGQDTVYFNQNWKKVKSKEFARYYEVLIPDSAFTLGQEMNFFDKNGKELKSIESADTYSIFLREVGFLNRKVERQFSRDGKIRAENYWLELPNESGNKKTITQLDGQKTEWYANGQIHTRINYNQGKYDGQFDAYWESGQQKRKDTYKEGNLIVGHCYNLNGTEIDYFPYMAMPEYKGGEKAILDYISRKLKYPVEMQRKHIQGKVIVRFVVRKDGSVSGVEVVKGVERELDEEAIRVVSSLPSFTPGMQDGENVSVWYTLPITFKLE